MYYDYNNVFGWLAGLSFAVVIIVLGISVGLSFIVSSIAKRKGYSAGAFWCLSFFLTFIVGIIVVCCVPDRTVPPPWFKTIAGAQPQPYAQAAQNVICPQCGMLNKSSDAFCLKCGAKLK